MPPFHRGRWALPCAALVLATVLTTAVGAQAHSALTSSNPSEGEVLATAPTSIELEFSDSIHDISPTVVVRDAAEDLVARPTPVIDDRVVTATLPEPLPDGSYSVVWRVVTEDGHPLQGVIGFAVGTPSEPTGDAASAASAADDPSSPWPLVTVLIVLVAAITGLAGRAGRRTPIDPSEQENLS